MVHICSASFFATVIAVSLIPVEVSADSCTVTSYDKVSNALKSCSNIIINGITVPGGETLELDLQTGSTLTFQGHIKFSHKSGKGPLVVVKGSKVTVEGASGSVLDGDGESLILF
mgnify:CR=1 FL=1